MYHLIMKEFLVQKKTILFSIIYTVFVAIVFASILPGGGAVYILAPVAVNYLFIMYSCGFDEKNNADVVFNSLPLKRDDIVIAKYSSTFFFAAFGILCSMIIGIIGEIIGIGQIERFIALSDIVSVFGIVMVFAAVFFPLYFKFGLNKMRIINIMLLLIPMFLPSLMVDYVKDHQEDPIVRNIISAIGNTQEWVLQTLIMVVCGILFLISVLISIKIYKNKDL